MARVAAGAERPLSPHIGIYRWPITMTMSIAHRVTGSANYFGTALVAFWLISAASGPEAHARAMWLFDSWIGKAVLIGYTWSVLHHMLGGLRHLVWDLTIGMDAPWRDRLAWYTLYGSVALTIALWVGIFLLG